MSKFKEVKDRVVRYIRSLEGLDVARGNYAEIDLDELDKRKQVKDNK